MALKREACLKDGKIEENWRELATAKLNQLIPNAGNCLVCGSVSTVAIQEHLVTPIVMDPAGGVMLGGTSYPHAMLTCNKCGNTRMFNYIILQPEGSSDQPDDGSR